MKIPDEEIDQIYQNHTVSYTPGEEVWQRIAHNIQTNEQSDQLRNTRKRALFMNHAKLNRYLHYAVRTAVLFLAVSGAVYWGHAGITALISGRSELAATATELKIAEKQYKKAKIQLVRYAEKLKRSGDAEGAQALLENIRSIDYAVEGLETMYRQDSGNNELRIAMGTVYYEQTELLLSTSALIGEVTR